jgi:hypothetical protein
VTDSKSGLEAFAGSLRKHGYAVSSFADARAAVEYLRLACSLYRPRTVYFVIGRNKLAPDLPAAIHRARNIASPKNAARLGLDLTCAKDLRCHDYNRPDRICRAMVIHMRPMLDAERTEAVLIGADLGY